MEDIDMETLDFDIYNREIYQKQENDDYSGTKSKASSHIDAFKKFKKAIDMYVKEYNEKNKIYEEKKNDEGENENINNNKVQRVKKFQNIFLLINLCLIKYNSFEFINEVIVYKSWIK